MIELVDACRGRSFRAGQPLTKDPARMDAMPDTIVRHVRPTFVHPTAIVARGAELGEGVRIGPY